MANKHKTCGILIPLEQDMATDFGIPKSSHITTSYIFFILFSLSRMNVPGLPNNWFWRVGLVAHRFYCLEASLNGSSLERFPTL